VLRRLTPTDRPDLLVGTETGDDAAVWRLDERRALVATADFITPLVDDARTWGRIAAANAASDVYAMGGRPLLALSLVGWTAELSTDLLVEVLQGAGEIAAEAGFVIAGGHTVDDPQPKYGLAVIGEVAPDRILTNTGLRPGDALVLSKPLGTGVVSTAVKRGVLTADDALHEAAVASMTRLNAEAARVALEAGATGATDVTGFGLLGHLRKMAEASGVDVDLAAASVPVLDGVRALAQQGLVPGGSRRNLAWAAERLDSGGVDDLTVLLLADAQTSGGLLFGADPDRAADAVTALRATGHDAALIGRARAGDGTTHLHP
jgi:selenide,water dikinase